MASQWQIQHAAQLIQQGGVIAYPTEAVWGLGCDPYNEQAVRRILAIKQRPMHKGLIVIAGAIEQFAELLQDLSPEQLQQLQACWPGPNTWLVPHKQRLPHWVTGAHSTVALRVSDHPLVQQLCALTGPIISTSANPAGLPAATSRLRIEQYFHQQLDAILDAPLGGYRSPSLIRDLSSGTVIRPM